MQTILVIEDEQSVRETLVEILEIEGFKTISAANGSVGVKLAQQYNPNLILCDVMMPELDGYEVLTRLRQHPDTMATPFIFLTARGDKADLRQGMSLGADDYLVKPCTVDELRGAITSRLEKRAVLEQRSQKKLDELRSSIVLSLPHEFCTPLNGILGFSEILIDEYEALQPQEVLEIAGDIRLSALRLHKLIQNFLLYAELEVVATDPDQLKALRNCAFSYPKCVIAQAAVEVAQQENRHLDLQLDLQLDQEDASICISELKLKKIVEELVSNACKFSRAGQPIRVASFSHQQVYNLSVTDQGRGMSSEQIENLGAYMQFERKIYEQQGSGLGLAIIQRLVELHAGELAIESLPGKRTTVRVTLPLQ